MRKLTVLFLILFIGYNVYSEKEIKESRSFNFKSKKYEVANKRNALFLKHNFPGINDIYSEPNIIWYGADFSLFRFLNPLRMGDESVFYKYIDGWIAYYSKEISLLNLKEWFGKNVSKNNSEITAKLYEKKLPKEWIVETLDDASYVTNEILKNHLSSYEESTPGLALVIIPLFFNQKKDNIQIKFVWFENENKTIIHVHDLAINARAGATEISHWGSAMIEATKRYSEKHYKLGQ